MKITGEKMLDKNLQKLGVADYLQLESRVTGVDIAVIDCKNIKNESAYKYYSSDDYNNYVRAKKSANLVFGVDWVTSEKDNVTPMYTEKGIAKVEHEYNKSKYGKFCLDDDDLKKAYHCITDDDLRVVLANINENVGFKEGRDYILVTKNGTTQKLYTDRMLCYNINMKKDGKKYGNFQ